MGLGLLATRIAEWTPVPPDVSYRRHGRGAPFRPLSRDAAVIHRRLAILTILIACPVACDGGAPPPLVHSTRPVSTCAAKWLAADTLIAGRGTPLVASPQLLISGGTPVVLGGQVDGGLFVHPADVSIPNQAGRQLSMVHPIAAHVNGEVHLVWGEGEAGAAAADHATRLYHAVRRHGAWTPPELIYEADFIRWHPLAASRLVPDRDGRLHLAVTSRHAAGSGLIYLKRENGRWSRHEQLLDGAPVYAEVAVTTDGEVVMAFVAPHVAASAPADANSVFVTRSSNGGRQWDKPRLVSLSGTRQASEPELVSTPGGRLHLLVAKNLAGGHQPESIWHFVSNDGGRVWSGPAVVSPGGRPYGLHAVRDDAEGAMYLAAQVEKSGPGGSRLAVLHFDGSTWGTPEHIAPDNDGFLPSLALDAERRPHLVGYVALDPSRRVPDWALARWVRQCDAGPP